MGDATGDRESAPEPQGQGAPSVEGPRGRRARSTLDRRPTRPRPVLGALGVVGLRLAAWLPRRVAYAIGGWAGRAASFLPIRERRATLVNLRIAFPELSAAERARLARESFAETGRNLMELGAMWCWDQQRLLRLVREVRGEEHLREALAGGKGAIMVMPHLGSWELTGLYCFTHYTMTALYRAPRVKEMEAIYTRSRERFGGKMVAAGPAGVRALFSALKRGELTVMLPDQDPGRGAGVFAPFFGFTANTSSLLSRLAQRSGAPVVFAYSERHARGDGFTLNFVPGSPGIHDPDLETSVATVNKDVERCVRALPAQYLWSYKRFRFQPSGTESPYKTMEV